MSFAQLERANVVVDKLPEKIVHCYKAGDLYDNKVHGKPLVALCGHIRYRSDTFKLWTPESNKEFCPKCFELKMNGL